MTRIKRIEDARLLLLKEGFSTEVSSIYVEAGFMGHQVDANLSTDKQKFKISAEVNTLHEIADVLENMVLLTKSLNKEYDCDISLRKSSRSAHASLTTQEKSSGHIKKHSTVYESYQELMTKGWGYSDTILPANEGSSEPTRRISLSRWDWHEKAIGTPVNFFHVFNANEDVLPVIALLSDRVFEAWEEFPDSIPFQDASGKLRTSFSATELVAQRADLSGFTTVG